MEPNQTAQAAGTYPPLVHALLQPQAYSPEGLQPRSIELVETHVSYLFLTGEQVYKVKKPVDYGFLDFTSLEKRRHFCQEEVRLNRRLSPSVYLGVVPVNEEQGAYSVNGPGKTVEYAVKMRQLPREEMLDARLRRHQVTAQDMEQVAARIAAFHQTAEASPEITRLGGLATVRHNVEENFAQTERYVDKLATRAMFEEIVAFSRGFIKARSSCFEQRESGGFIRDCHGDLHTAQVCLLSNGNNGIEFIDCIEFNPLYRYSDVASDLAFLAMDLDHHGRHDLSAALWQAYGAASGDTEAATLGPFYQCYRAYVRAKVTSFKLDSAVLAASERAHAQREASSYYRLAHHYAKEALPHPALYLMAGLVGTGKSAVAENLADRWGIAIFTSDVERKHLAGLAPTQHQYVPYGTGIYAPGFDEATYQQLFEKAAQELQAGHSVVLDASFRLAGLRRKAVRLAGQAGATTWIIECSVPEATVRQRLEQRVAQHTSVSDAGWEVYERQRSTWEPVNEVPASRHIRIDTSSPLEETARRVVNELYLQALAA